MSRYVLELAETMIAVINEDEFDGLDEVSCQDVFVKETETGHEIHGLEDVKNWLKELNSDMDLKASVREMRMCKESARVIAMCEGKFRGSPQLFQFDIETNIGGISKVEIALIKE
jgi:hypothetical protein